MVIRDQSTPITKKKRFRSPKVKEEWSLASPADRLAATVVDFVILVPLISLAFALVKKEMVLAQFLGSNPELHFLMTVYYVVSPLLIHTIYQVVFLSFLGATPGKFFFDLRVKDVWTHRNPHWQRSMLRGFLWWVDAVLLIPLLSLFWDTRRRPIHDRLSDTIVTCAESRSVESPGFFEVQLARFFFLMAVVGGVGYVAGQSPKVYQLAVRNGIELADWVGGKDTCETVDGADEAWPQEKAKGRRLRIALALFAARSIESDCLNAEADHYIWLENKHEEDQGIGYLAKAFATLDEPESSDRYLEKVCEVDAAAEACHMSRIFSLWSEQRWQEVDRQFTVLNSDSSTYVKLWAIRHYFRFGKIDKALELIDDVSPNFALADFLGEYRIKALWRSERWSEAENVFKIYWESRDNRERLHLASWLCYEEMLEGCSGWQRPSCRILDQAVKRFPTIQEESRVALTRLRAAQCADEEIDANGFLSPEVISLAEATDAGHWQAHEIFDSLKTFAEDAQRGEVIRFDALWRAVERAESKENLAQLEKIWSAFEPSDGWNWALIGRKISERFNQLGADDRALSVAQKVYQANNGYKGVLRQLAALHFKNGRRREAWTWLKKYRVEETGREPAAADDWQSIERALTAEFGVR